jgi:hypothetical protein
MFAKKTKNLPLCTRRYTKSKGLPYKCTIKTKLDTQQPLFLVEFDTSWHLRIYRDKDRHLVLPPRKTYTRVFRKARSHPTGRTESGFEKAVREEAQRIASEKGKRCLNVVFVILKRGGSIQKQWQNA